MTVVKKAKSKAKFKKKRRKRKKRQLALARIRAAKNDSADRPVLAFMTAVGMAHRQADGSLVAAPAPGGGECFLFGPHWCLTSGLYRLSFEGEIWASRQHGQPVLGVEIIAQNRFRRHWQDFTELEFQAGPRSVEFSVPPEMGVAIGQESRFEFKFFHFGDGTIKLASVTLTRLGDYEAQPPPAPVWRLLGRMRKAWTARQMADGSVATRGPSPGFFLGGVWPYLRLAAGRYRLTTRAQGQDDGPLLEVRVLARSHWRRRPLRRLLGYGIWRPDLAEPLTARQFQAAELGEAAMEFIVPARLGIESGEDAPIEFQFHRLTPAALAVSDVTLERLGPADEFSGPDTVVPGSAVPGLRRKRVVVIGNCQADIICNGFQQIDSLRHRFDARYHFVNLHPNLQAAARHDLEGCEIVLAQSIADWEDYPLRDAIPDGVPIVRFPLLRFASLWPFDHYNGPGDADAYNREWPNLTFTYLDGLLGQLRRDIPDPAARFEAYRTLAIPGLVNYRRMHELEARRLAAMDVEFDSGIGRFILENFKTRRLFYTTNHPNGDLLAQLMQLILKRMGEDPAGISAAPLDMLSVDQVPVHPKLAADLGVRWVKPGTRYLFRGEMVKWDSYIRRYIEHYG